MDDYNSLHDQAKQRQRKLLITIAGLSLGLIVIAAAVSWRSSVNKKRREQQVLALLEPLAQKLRAHPDGFFSPPSPEYCNEVANHDAALGIEKNLTGEYAKTTRKLNQEKEAAIWGQEQFDLALYNETLAISYNIYRNAVDIYTTAGISTEKMNAEVRPLLASKIGNFATLLDLDKCLRDQHPAFRRVASALGNLICHEQELLERIGSEMRYAEISLDGWESISKDDQKIANLVKRVTTGGLPYFPVKIDKTESAWITSFAANSTYHQPIDLVKNGTIKSFVQKEVLDVTSANTANLLLRTHGLEWQVMRPGMVVYRLCNHPDTNQEMLDAINQAFSDYRSLVARFHGSKPKPNTPNTLAFPRCTVEMGPIDYRSHPPRRGLEGFRSLVFNYPLRQEEAATKVDSEETHKTRYGTLTVKPGFIDSPTLLLFNGKVVHKADDTYISLDSVFHLEEADVVVSKTSYMGNAVDGTGIMLITVGSGGTTKASPEFAQVEAKNESGRSIKRDRDKIVITTSKGLNKGNDVFVYQNGVVTQDGRPVK